MDKHCLELRVILPQQRREIPAPGPVSLRDVSVSGSSIRASKSGGLYDEERLQPNACSFEFREKRHEHSARLHERRA